VTDRIDARWTDRSRRVGGWLGFGVVMTIGLAGCCGMLGGDGGGKHHCWAAVEWKGQRASAAGSHAKADKAKADAHSGMCMLHCEVHDPDVTKALAAYRKSPKGEKSRAGRSFDIGQDPTAKRHYDRCVADCAAAVGSGSAKTKFQCQARSRKSCSADLDYQGKKHAGKATSGKGELEAWRLACRSYCKKDDPAVTKAYEEWAASPQGKKYKTPRDKALESERPSDEVGACQGRCIADILFGTASVTVACED
jgi:hypothetical protein